MEKRGIAPVIIVVIALVVVASSAVLIVVNVDNNGRFDSDDDREDIDDFLREKGILPDSKDSDNGKGSDFIADIVSGIFRRSSSGGGGGGGSGGGSSGDGGAGGSGGGGNEGEREFIRCSPDIDDETYLYDSEIELITFNKSNGKQSFYIKNANTGEYLRKNFSNEVYFLDSTRLLNVSYKINEACGGVDIIYEVKNPTANSVELPTFIVDGLIQDISNLKYLNTKDSGNLEELVIGNNGIAIDKKYPWLYSPVVLVQDGENTIASSFIYPYPDYKNEVNIALRRTDSGEQAGTISHVYDASPLNTDDSFIEAGVSWNYNISLRFTSSDSENWIYSLYPYKKFFQSFYGSYSGRNKDTRPIFKVDITNRDHEINATNPRGYNSELNLYRDGWGPFVDQQIAFLTAKGYDRFVLWAPSGKYPPLGASNYPSQFMDFLPFLEETDYEFEKFEQNGIELGYWWGRADQYPNEIIPYWDNENYPSYNIAGDYENEEFREFALGQLGKAVNREAKLIGLDNFVKMPVWQRYYWIDELKAAAPEVFFVGEDSQPDFIHSKIGNWYYPGRWGRNTQPGPDRLSEYLGNENSEIWVQLRDEIPDLDTINQLREWGFTPVVQHPEINLSTFLLSPPAECSDKIDNDNDKAIDFPLDADCESLEDKTERVSLTDTKKVGGKLSDYVDYKDSSAGSDSSSDSFTESYKGTSLTGNVARIINELTREGRWVVLVILIASAIYLLFLILRNKEK